MIGGYRVGAGSPRPRPAWGAVTAPLLAVAALLAAGCGPDGGGGSPPPEPVRKSTAAHPAPAGSGLVFESLQVDFGGVFQGAEATRDVPFRNAAGVPIRILEVRPTCGCTAGVPDVRDIPPGGEGKIRVTFRPENRRGTVHAMILIRTDFPSQPAVSLSVTALARPVFDVVPPVLELGEMPRGAEIVREFTVREAAGKPFAATAVATLRSDVRAELLTTGPAVEHRIRMTARTGESSGPFLGTVTVTTDRAGVPPPEVMFQGTVRGDVEAAPLSLFLGSVRKGGRFAPGTVAVTGRLPFTIENVETGDPAVRATIRTGSTDRSYSIEIAVEGDLVPGRFERTVQIRTSAPGPPLEVTVSGVVTEAK